MSANFIHGTNFPSGSLPDHLKPKPVNHTERFSSFLEECAFFSTTSGETFLAPDPNHAPGFLIPINHPSCRQFLCQQYSRRFGSSPPPGALRSALARAHDSARAAALRDFSPALRIAPLSNPKAIAIRHGRSPGHWYIAAEDSLAGSGQQSFGQQSSVRQVPAHESSQRETNFYAGRGGRPLPQPAPDAPVSALDDFFHLLRIPAGSARLRCLAWLLSAFRPSGPYPILILRGPSGSGKSCAARALRALTDPNDTPLHPIPPSPNQLRHLAYENWVLAFDHLTRFPRRTTESLARLTENEVHYLPPKRDPATVSLARPVLLTVADSCHLPPEIAARSLTIELSPMPDAERKTEAQLQSELEALLPQALARLLKALSAALSAVPDRPFPLPRLADAAAWACAAAPALGFTPAEMLQALSTPLDPLVERIAALMHNLEIWRGSATQLAAALNLDCDGSQLSRQLFQIENQTALNSIGLAVTRRHGGLSRSIEITWPDPKKLDKNLQNAVSPSLAGPPVVAQAVLPPPGAPDYATSGQSPVGESVPTTVDLHSCLSG